jgi:hypothetical protein
MYPYPIVSSSNSSNYQVVECLTPKTQSSPILSSPQGSILNTGIFSYPATKHFHLVVKIKMDYHFWSHCPAAFYYFLFSSENLEQQAF